MKKLILIILLSVTMVLAKAQWVNQNAGFSDKTLGFYEFSIVNENVVWAICYDGIGGLFGTNPILNFTKTVNGGSTWLPGVMNEDSSLAFSNISALNENEAWVAMHKFNFSGGGGLFHTINGGLTWNESNAGIIFNESSFPNFVYFKDGLNGIAGGDANDGFFEFYKTLDGGETWTRTPHEEIPDFISGGGYGWFDGFAVVGETIWFGTSAGEIYKSTDFGNTWVVNTLSPDKETVYEIAFNDDGLHGLAHVRNSLVTKLFATSDGGITWLQIVTSTIPFWKQSRICSVPGTNTFVSTSTNNTGGGSSFSNDNGVTWTLIEDSSPKAACRFYNATTGWSGGYFNDNILYPISDGIFKWDNTISYGTSINEVRNFNFTFYPNPTNGVLILNFSANTDTQIKVEIVDLFGSILVTKYISKVTLNTIQIDVSNFAQGAYFIKVSSANDFIIKTFILN